MFSLATSLWSGGKKKKKTGKYKKLSQLTLPETEHEDMTSPFTPIITRSRTRSRSGSPRDNPLGSPSRSPNGSPRKSPRTSHLQAMVTATAVPKLAPPASSPSPPPPPPPPVDPIDPISLEPIPAARAVIVDEIAFDIVSLCHWLSQSRDFRHPLTMEPLTEQDIRAIDSRSFDFLMSLPQLKGEEESDDEDEDKEQNLLSQSRSGSCDNDVDGEMNLPTLLPLFRKTSSEASAAEKRSHFSLVQSLDCILGGFIAEIMELVEEDAEEENGDFACHVLQIMSELLHPWNELKKHDPQAAFLLLQSYKGFLRGPAKKPTHDPRRRLVDVIRALDSTCLTAADVARHVADRRHRSVSFDVPRIAACGPGDGDDTDAGASAGGSVGSNTHRARSSSL